MTSLPVRRMLLPVALLACLALAGPAAACPFCGMSGPTLTQEAKQANMVLYGYMSNGKPGNPDADLAGGTTDFVIEKQIKPHPFVAGKTKISLPRYIPTRGGKVPYLVFCDVFKGKIDPYRGVPLKGSDLPAYLDGALKVKDKKLADRLRYFFDYLNNDDLEVANDALKEFGNVGYDDYKDLAKTLPGDKVAKWLRDPKTPGYRFGLYASILGHCSKNKAEDAKLLRSFVDDPEKRVSSGVDGILAGYVMLQPKEGWAYVRGILQNPKSEFLLRYAAIRAVRFFAQYREDLVSRKECIEAVKLLLAQPGSADIAIEDLRKWEQWDLTDRILGLLKKDEYDLPIIQRAVLRFMISSPKKAAKAYVEKIRKEDEEAVTDAEELLKIEQQRDAASPPAPSK